MTKILDVTATTFSVSFLLLAERSRGIFDPDEHGQGFTDVCNRVVVKRGMGKENFHCSRICMCTLIFR